MGSGGGGGAGGGAGARRSRRTTIGAKSLGAQFRENLNNLVSTVDKTHPHYVRTIKPNDELAPSSFVYERIAEQLRNAGVLEVVRVARAGFPVRFGIQVPNGSWVGFLKSMQGGCGALDKRGAKLRVCLSIHVVPCQTGSLFVHLRRQPFDGAFEATSKLRSKALWRCNSE